MRFARYVTLLVGATALAGTVLAQPGPVLREQDLTEENVIRELTPTRQIKPEREQGVSLLITFQTNSANLTPAAMKSLDVVARALQSAVLSAYGFVVEGHADPRGNFNRNMRLSKARAQSVVKYLVSSHQIESDRLKAVGKGSTEQYNTADPTAPENRRVTIKRLAGEDE